jgi:hypothetical protein
MSNDNAITINCLNLGMLDCPRVESHTNQAHPHMAVVVVGLVLMTNMVA